MPSVSVVVPTYGRPELLRRAIDSVLIQTFADYELIVVIDGEDPSTLECLAAINDPRLSVISHPTNLGAGRARDTGAAASRGDWVAFLDDDDEWLPTKLERQFARTSVPAVLMTLSRVVTPSGVFIRPAEPYRPDQMLDEWLFGRRTWFKGGESFLQSSSLMFPRRAFESLRFSNTHEDWEIVLRAVKELGYPLVTVAEPLVIHYLGEARPSLSNTFTWKRSLDWINGLGDLITPKAYAGFCLTVASRAAANKGESDALIPLAQAAFARGRPTLRQLLAFTIFWTLPRRVRHSVRARLQGVD